MFLILLVFVAVCVGVVLYGYKRPTSKVGLFIIEVRAICTSSVLSIC